MKQILMLFLTLSSKNHVQAATYINVSDVKPKGPDGKPTDLLSRIIQSSTYNSTPFPLTSISAASPITPISTFSISTTPSSISSISITPNLTSSYPNKTSSASSIINSPSSRINNTNSLNSTSINTLLKSKQGRKSIKPLFGLVPTKDFFKILETPMIYRPAPVYNIGLRPTPTPPPFLNPLRRASSSILCQDFVTPILTAAIRNLTYPYIVTSKDHFITRILRLLHTDISTATEDDVKTMVWQVSNIDIRLYQWSALAMAKILNTITLHNEEDHWTLAPKLRSLRNFKHELEAILLSWRLDLSDKEPILRDSKIIRPPCCCGNTLGQSTLAPTNSMFTTKTTKETKSARDMARMGPEGGAGGAEEEVVEYEDDSLEVPSAIEAKPTSN